MTGPRMLALAVARSGDRKTGPVAATYAGVESSCGPCPLKGICYARRGLVGMHVRPLDARAAELGADARDVARDEARAIDALPGGPRARPLRLHVSGDCRTATAARIVSAAADRYRQRTGRQVWTYTHAWRTVPREAWGAVSVLASCETAADAAAATARGYAVALVVDDLAAAAGKAIGASGLRGTPCAYDRGGPTCDQCRLCWDDAGLRQRGRAILFARKGGGRA